MTGAYHPRTFLDHVEETFIALILGAMTVITFANVIARYVFNDNITWALEATGFLFAWLVLIGASYCIKVRMHIGVDVLINVLSPGVRRAMGLFSAACCIIFALLLVYGAFEYWLPFAGKNAFYEVVSVPMFDWLRFIEPILNYGEPYEKLPRFIPYFALPLGCVLIALRFIQAGWRIWKGVDDRLITSHEAEDLVEEAAQTAKKGA